jgi:tetratricopeptide (TPR) repeat protein
MRRLFFVLFLAVCLSTPLAFSQEAGTFGLYAGTGTDFPLGPSSSFFASPPVIVDSVLASFAWRLAGLPFLYLLAEPQWVMLTPKTADPVHDVSLAAGLGLAFDILPWLTAKADVAGGGYFAWLSGGGNAYPTLDPILVTRAGLGARFGSVLVEALATYVNYFGLYQGAGFSVSAGLQLGSGKAAAAPERPVTPKPLEKQAPPAEKPADAKPAEAAKPDTPAKPAPAAAAGEVGVEGFESAPVFPVFYKYYDDHPLGSLTLRNGTAAPITRVKVKIWIKQYMDGPKDAQGPAEVQPGEAARYPLFAIFTDKILEINEPTKAQGQIDITYEQGGKQVQQTVMETLRILDRNAMTWDDDRRAAAFISSKDPGTMSFAKRTVNLVKKNANPALNANLQVGMGIHEALTLYGIGYVQDPKSASIGSGKAKDQPDFLQFPRQTLEFKSGDCDDLSILYCSLFESVGVDTALITVPGHIYMAFSAGLTPDQARKNFSRVDELIIRGDKVWVPVEVTSRSDFLTVWQEGAKEWRENQARSQASFYEVHDAWGLYEPAGLPGSGPSVAYPEEPKLAALFVDMRDSFVEREISGSVATLQAQVKKSNDAPKTVNSLGVLYAKYGLYDKAAAQFRKAVKKEEYAPALLNLGTITYRRGDREGALALFERARVKQPDNPQVLLALARASHDMENYYAVHKYYGDLKKIDPTLAEQFAYLDLRGEEAARAADVSGVKEVVLWAE